MAICLKKSCRTYFLLFGEILGFLRLQSVVLSFNQSSVATDVFYKNDGNKGNEDSCLPESLILTGWKN
jgi:hypothetical protein